MPWQPVWSTFVPRFGVPVSENLTLCRELGVESLELYWRSFFRQRTIEFGAGLKAVWGEAGVIIDSLHGPHGVDCNLADEDADKRRSAVALWRELLPPFAATGARIVVMHPSAGRTPRADRPEAAGRLAESLRELVPLAQERRITLALENLGPGQFGCREGELLGLIEAFDSPALGICFDTGHAHLSGRLLELHEAVADRCVHYHISDNDRVADRHAAPPYGTIPWQPFWQQVAARAPSSPLLIEVPPTADRSVADLRELATAMVNSCLDSAATPRLGPAGGSAFVKSAKTGCFEIIRSLRSA